MFLGSYFHYKVEGWIECRYEENPIGCEVIITQQRNEFHITDLKNNCPRNVGENSLIAVATGAA